MKTLRQQLIDECPSYRLPDELMDEFMGAMTKVPLKSKQALISYGQFDDNVYVVKNGIIRYCYFDGIKEKTYGFASPGTIMISYHCYFMRQPSYFQLESCGKSVVMKIPKRTLDKMVRQSHEFAQWMFALSLGQLYSNELKYSVINGMAKERFIALVKNRPEIIERVPLKVIASYLGVTPAYLSRVKKNIPDR